MKHSKNRLLLTFLSSLCLSLSWAKTVSAGSKTDFLPQGDYLTITCQVNSNGSTLVEAKGKLVNVKEHAVGIEIWAPENTPYIDAPLVNLLRGDKYGGRSGNINFSQTVGRELNAAGIYGTVTGFSYGIRNIEILTYCK